MAEDTLEELYRSSRENVRPRLRDAATASAEHGAAVSFVTRTAGTQRGSLLEVGCGDGWVSWLLSEAGFDVTGLDLHSDGFVPEEHERLKFRQGSALDLPFANESFEMVATNQTLEHVPDTERALREMLRVLKPGGFLAIVSPNLLSPLASIQAATRYVWANRPWPTIFVRKDGMPKHPFGNTLPEVLGTMVWNWGRIVKKLAEPRPEFTTRKPDLTPPFHADNDATYVCNPIDLKKRLPELGCEILQVGAYGRPRGTWLLASGTWIAGKKT